MERIDPNELARFEARQEMDSIIPIAELHTDMADALAFTSLSGDPLPWSRTHDWIRLNPSELSVWSGQSGAGKTTLVYQVINQLMPKRKALFISLEMPYLRTLKILATQVAGCSPAVQLATQWAKSCPGWVYDSTEKSTPLRMAHLIAYVCEQYQPDYIVIDSLMMVCKRDDYEEQARFSESLRLLSKKYNTHIALVAHAKKSEMIGRKLDKWSVKGAVEITDVASSVFLVNKNTTRMQAKLRVQNGQPLEDRHAEALENGFDCWFEIAKNREEGIEEGIGLFYSQDSRQFTQVENKPYKFGVAA